MTGPRALLSGLVDYAGLFPPAALGMEDAVAEYARWLRSPQAFMLGRFVLPAARLGELARAAEGHWPQAGTSEPWRLSALVGPDARADAARLSDFSDAHAGRALVDAAELRVGSEAEAADALDALPPGVTAYCELPLSGELAPLLALLRSRGARAKVRTGGTVAEAIPPASDLARFLVVCAAAGVPFKATAGLHHPVRGEQALTYDDGAPRAVMHGFLNVFTAAALAYAGAPLAEVEAALLEEDEAAFALQADGLTWRGRRLPAEELARSRAAFACSFGSCSFAEPVAELQQLGAIE